MSALRSKIDAVRKVSAPVPKLSDVLGALTKHLEKEARIYLGSVVEAMILDVETKVFSDVLDAISMPAMIAMIEVDGVERAALVNLDLDLVYHVVDLRLGGLPTELPEFGARRPTPLDSDMCSALIDIALEGLSTGLADAFGSEDPIEMRCTGFEHLPMLANIASDNADVFTVQVSLDIGEAARSGNFTMVLPFSTLDLVKAHMQRSASVSSAASNDAWAQHMLEMVLDTEVDLTPVLYSTEMSVAELSTLQLDQVIRLEEDAHQRIELQVGEGGDAQCLATARLGALRDHKALKLTCDLDPAFMAPMRAVARPTSNEKGN